MAKTAVGLEENVAGLLCYVLGWVSGIVFLIIEPKNKFVRYHAMQSIITFGIITAVLIVLSALGMIPFLGLVFDIISGIIGALAFILWIVLMVTAVQGKKLKLPWAGDQAEKWAGKA
jgi:uncharacterized membrane protein